MTTSITPFLCAGQPVLCTPLLCHGGAILLVCCCSMLLQNQGLHWLPYLNATPDQTLSIKSVR